MAGNNPQLPIVEPLHFHQVHGEQIRLSENNTRATRDRLNNTLVFTNRPILSNEIVQILIEEIAADFYGLIRIGLTSIDPMTFTKDTLPKSMPSNDPRNWIVPTPRGTPDIKKNKIIRLKYTADSNIYVDYDGTGFVKTTIESPIITDVWCALDLSGIVAQIRLVQNDVRVLPNPVDRARARYCQYTNNRQQENASIYYSGELSNGIVIMNNCDENCEVTENIAVRKSSRASITVDENLQRCMCVVMQILDIDHTLTGYLTVKCLINDTESNDHQKAIDASFSHLVLGDEIGIRVSPEGQITFSCNNRNIKPLFNIDLTVNDNPQARPVPYKLQFVLNGRITALRLVGIYHPTAEERKPPPAVGGGCLATVRYRVCPNGLTGLLLPCRHLCVCHECGQALIERHTCPNIKCRKPVTGCIKVFRD